jgi:hypothetical protein
VYEHPFHYLAFYHDAGRVRGLTRLPDEKSMLLNLMLPMLPLYFGQSERNPGLVRVSPATR